MRSPGSSEKVVLLQMSIKPKEATKKWVRTAISLCLHQPLPKTAPVRKERVEQVLWCTTLWASLLSRLLWRELMDLTYIRYRGSIKIKGKRAGDLLWLTWLYEREVRYRTRGFFPRGEGSVLEHSLLLCCLRGWLLSCLTKRADTTC